MRGILQPFGELQAQFSGGGEVLTLTHVEAEGRPTRLSGVALYCGFYLNELLMRLLERGDPHQALYTDYQQTLDCLGLGNDIEPCLRRFELNLLKRLGYGICLEYEAVTGEAVRPDSRYRYELETGLIRQGVRDQQDDTVQGTTLMALASDDMRDMDSRREARHLMRRILSHYLGGKPLKSRELFRGY
jgi:DNA repair protein RecO (recombination protein O)